MAPPFNGIMTPSVFIQRLIVSYGTKKRVFFMEKCLRQSKLPRYILASKLMSTKIIRNEMKFRDLVFDLPEIFYSNF